MKGKVILGSLTSTGAKGGLEDGGVGEGIRTPP